MAASNNYIFGCHITGVYDVNRNITLANNDISICLPWLQSIKAAGLKAVLFHNNLLKQTINAYSSNTLQLVQINYDARFAPNVYRYKAYCDYLQQYGGSIDNVFVTDVADVVLLNNPFTQPLFVQNTNHLFCGDEPTVLNNPWMNDHSAHFRATIPTYREYESAFANYPLLNCGIAGGAVKVMQPFLQALWHLHANYNLNNQTAYTGDMGAFNYLLRMHYQNRVIHGAPVNTVFKAYDQPNTQCWFRHK